MNATILSQLKLELNSAFEKYDKTHHIPTDTNAECITQLRSLTNQSTMAFKLIQDLPPEIQKLDSRFLGFLPFVQDPIRELKIGLMRILSKKNYQRQVVLETESIELHLENSELKQRLDAVERSIKRPSVTPIHTAGIDSQIQQTLEAQIRAEVENEVKEEVQRLSQQLAEEQETNQRLQTDTKRLQFKCEAYQKQTHQLITEKQALEQQLGSSVTRVSELLAENAQLKQRLTRLESLQQNQTSQPDHLEAEASTGPQSHF